MGCQMKQHHLIKDREADLARVGKNYDPARYMAFGPLKLHKPYLALTTAYRYGNTRKPPITWGGCQCSPKYGVHGAMVSNTGGFNGWSWIQDYNPPTPTCRECIIPAGSWQSDRPMVCEWCGFVAQIVRQIERDHILPEAEGGRHTKANLQYLCANCHALKTGEDWIRFGWHADA